jgi:CRISPR type III-A-associated RAMP protein Csm4
MPLERPALLVQLQPVTPWRCSAGRPGEPASLLPSDSFFGALSDAMLQLGWLPDWLNEGAPATRFSSLLPFHNDSFHAPLPESLRSAPGLRKLRLPSVRFAPLPAIEDLANRRFDESRWVLDLASGCLLAADRAGAGGPFRSTERSRAAVDRLHGLAAPAASTSGVEFADRAGLWSIFVFDSPDSAAIWSPRLKAALRLLADSGIGGWRNAGWGRSRRPRFREGDAGRLLSNAGWKHIPAAPASHWWTLGLFAPASDAPVAWDAGAYQTIHRAGWTAAAGPKPALRLVREGAVLASPSEPLGLIASSSVEGLPHPVFRYAAGLALPWQEAPLP